MFEFIFFYLYISHTFTKILIEISFNSFNLSKTVQNLCCFWIWWKRHDKSCCIWHLHRFYDTPKINSNYICIYGHEIIKFSYSSSKLSFLFYRYFQITFCHNWVSAAETNFLQFFLIHIMIKSNTSVITAKNLIVIDIVPDVW